MISVNWHAFYSCSFLPYATLETGELTFTVLAILCQHEIWLAATAEMSDRLLDAVVFTSSVADGAGMDSCGEKTQNRKIRHLCRKRLQMSKLQFHISLCDISSDCSVSPIKTSARSRPAR